MNPKVIYQNEDQKIENQELEHYRKLFGRRKPTIKSAPPVQGRIKWKTYFYLEIILKLLNIRIAIQWMPRPNPIPGCPSGLEYLTNLQKVLIYQKVDMMEVFTGIYHKIKFSY
jgi:hypothetical protein